MRFLLVDRIVDLDGGRLARGIKNVAMSEDFLTHHFPRSPILPGALITESMVQLASWLIRESTDFERSGLVQAVHSARFHHMVRPGDQLLLEVTLMERDELRAEFKASASCAGKRVAKARLTLGLIDTEILDDVREIRHQFQVLCAGLGEETAP